MLTFLTQPMSGSVPLFLQISVAQVIALLLASLAASRAFQQLSTPGQRRSIMISAEIMLSVALLSIILASNLPESDTVRPDQGLALILRLVLGGSIVSLWHTVYLRLRA